MIDKLNTKIPVIFSMILAAALTRLLPHPPNFTAISAIAIFGGAVLSKRWHAVLIVFTSLFISDLLINNLIFGQYYGGFTFFTEGAIWIYSGLFAMILLGSVIKELKIAKIAGVGIIGSVIFYLLTNFGAWLGNPMYPQTIEGLWMSYAAGIPFLVNAVGGTLFYSGLLFYGYHIMRVKKPAWLKVNK